MANSYNTIIKGQLVLHRNKHFFIFEEDKLEVPAVVQPKFFFWLKKNSVNISYPRAYQAQYKTSRLPYLIVDEVRNIDLSDTISASDTFYVVGTVFRVYKNCIDKYEAKYNFMLVLVGESPFRFPLKICYSKLDDYNLINRRIRFCLKRIGTNLVLQSYYPVDIDEPPQYGVIE